MRSSNQLRRAGDRIFRDARGAAAGRIDLLTLATHEIGHLLGLSDIHVGYAERCGGSSPFLCLVDITTSGPFAGLEVQLGFGPHIDQGPFGFDDAGPLMILDKTEGERQLFSGIDALALAGLSSIDKFKLPGRSGPAPTGPGRAGTTRRTAVRASSV